MKKILFVLLLICSTLLYDTVQAQNAPCSDCGNLVIASVVNTAGSGNTGGIQFCAVNDIPDLSIYYFMSEDSDLSNSEWLGTPNNVVDFSGSLLAGECFWAVQDSTKFEEYMAGTFDFAAPDVDALSTSSLDDDRNLILLCKGNIDDIYGYYIPGLAYDDDFSTKAIDDIPSDDPAYYDNTWILSNNDRCPNSGTMDLANWTIGPVDDLLSLDFITESTFPGANYTSSTACSNVRTCGGVQFCSDFIYTCVEDPDGANDFLISINYIGMEPGLVMSEFDDFGCNLTIHPSSDDPATTPDGTIVLLNLEQDSSCGQGTLGNTGDNGNTAVVWGVEFLSPGCDGVQIWDRLPEICQLTCSNGVQDGDEEGVDCGGSCPNICQTMTEPTCDDGMMNGDETGVDCGGATCPPCAVATCDDGIMNGDETGVDCGGATCEACDTTTDPTCDDGIMNGDETGVDCGGATCPPCEVIATCTDGIMNGDETGIDCGGATCEECAPSPAAIPTMSQWGLILLTLLTLTFVTVSVASGQLSAAGAGTFSTQKMSSLSSYPFVKSVFVKAMIFTALCALVAAIGTLAVYGSITTTDFVGTMIAGPVFAYLLHLLILLNKK